MTSLATVIGRGTNAARPAAGTPGALWYDTTNNQMTRDNGTTWDVVEPTGGGAPTGAAGGDLSGTYPNPTVGIVTAATSVAVTGLTGSVAASRYVGATASGAPTSGAHLLGDWVIEQTGKVYICTTAGTPGTWTLAGGGGGGGNSTSTGTYASEPAAGTAGNLYLPNDGFAIERDSGSAFIPWGPIYPFTKPPSPTGGPSTTQFGWANQGSATVAASKSGIYLSCPNDTADSWKFLVKTAPATPYTLTVYIEPIVFANNYMAFGVGWRDSATGNFVVLYEDWENGQIMNVGKGASNALTSNYLGTGIGRWNIFKWLRISDDGTNRLTSISMDGQNWMQINTIGHTDYITPNQLIVGIDPRNSAGLGEAITIMSWKES